MSGNYTWSVRTKSNLGVTGPYATDFTVTLVNASTGSLAAQEFRRDIFAGIETFPEVFNQRATNVGTNTIELTWDTIGVPDYGEGS